MLVLMLLVLERVGEYNDNAKLESVPVQLELEHCHTSSPPTAKNDDEEDNLGSSPHVGSGDRPKANGPWRD